MKEKKLISVIVYLYNNEDSILDFLSRVVNTINSVFEQFEIIIVNDFSSDASVQKIKEASFLENYQVTIIQMSFHQGVELSMSAGLDLSSGDFVYEFDSTLIDYNENLILQSIVQNIKSVDNFSLICQTIVKNVKNDNNALLFSNLILHYSDKVQFKDIESEALTKLYSMSLKSQMPSVRFFAIQNLKSDLENLIDFKTQLSELKLSEKNEKVLEALK